MGRLILLFALPAALGGCELVPAATAIWPYPGATGLSFDSSVIIEHDVRLDRGLYGLELPYHLEGPDGEVELVGSLEEDEQGWRDRLRLTPAHTLAEGSYTLTVDVGSDSNNFRSIYRTPSNLFGSFDFSTASDPAPLCITWYDYDDGFVTDRWATGRQPCVHFTEPLVPGPVDLALGQVRVSGADVKASGDVPEEFPELLCALLPDEPEPLDWEITLTGDDVNAVAGGALQAGASDASVTLRQHESLWCQSVTWLLPRWRPDDVLD